MKFLIILVMFSSFTMNTSDNKTARDYYLKASENKEYAEKLKTFTQSKINFPLLKAYNGVALAILAKHSWNPYTKLENVKSGLKNINEAVSSQNSDLEIRFLRFSVEENIPSVVPFTSHINEDKKFLLKNWNKNHEFYSTMCAYLKKSSQFTEEEKKKL